MRPRRTRKGGKSEGEISRGRPRMGCEIIRGGANDRGSALVMVLLAMTVLMLLGLAFTFIASTELRVAAAYRNGLSALDLAEAGLDRSIASLKADPRWRAGFTNVSLGGGTYTVTASETEPGKLLLTSTGIVGSSRRVLTAKLSSGGGQVYQQYAILAGSDLTLEKDSKLEGDVFVNRNFVALGHKNQDIEVDGLVSIAPGGTKTVNEYTSTGGYPAVTQAIPLPVESADWYKGQATSVMTGPVNFPHTNVFSGDLIYVEGDVKINGEVSGRGSIVATGTIEIHGKLEYKGDQSALALIGLGGISVTGAGEVEAVLYSPGTVTIQNNSDIKGGVYAGTISAGQRVEIKYDQKVLQGSLPPGLPGTGWTLTSWSESNP